MAAIVVPSESPAASLAGAPSAVPARGELDELTLARARRGDAAACRALVVRYERPVHALLGRMVGARGVALVEDLAQETFLRAFSALGSFDPAGRARLSTWLLTIATRLALDELRRRPVATAPLETAAATVAAPDRTDAGAERRAIARALQAAVDSLAPEYRAAFLLRELHGLEYAEVATALAVDLGTVKSRLSRARAALRTALAEVADA